MTAQEADRAMLRSALMHNLRLLNDSGIITESRKQDIVDSLETFCMASMLKYIRGQKEHGDNITSRQLDAEIYNELVDIFWYTEAKQWRA
ncbi:MAG TPA: hypothetical protein VL854_03580 [Nitrososphaeraceae archaeon]|nr:hypothetical protein [Nitrososphaeraceae archaeon]